MCSGLPRHDLCGNVSRLLLSSNDSFFYLLNYLDFLSLFSRVFFNYLFLTFLLLVLFELRLILRFALNEKEEIF